MVDFIYDILEFSMSTEVFIANIPEFLASLEAAKASFQTFRAAKSSLDVFTEWLKSNHVDRISRRVYIQWLNEIEESYQITSLKTRHSHINKYFLWMVSEHIINVNPLFGVHSIIGVSDSNTPSTFRHLLSGMPALYYKCAEKSYFNSRTASALKDWVIVELLYCSGAFPSAIQGIKVDLEAQVFYTGIGSFQDDAQAVCKLLSPTPAIETYMSLNNLGSSVFYGKWLEFLNAEDEVRKSLMHVRRAGKFSELLSSRDFALNLCAELYKRGVDITEYRNYTGRSIVWCGRVYQELRQAGGKR